MDVSFDLPPAQATAAKKAGITVTSTETAIKIIAFLDSTKAPFDDPKLREAAALAIDRDAIVKGIFDGQAVADAGLLNVSPGQKPAQSVTADPAKAKELVGAAAPAVQIHYPAAQYTNIEEVSQAVGGALEKAGFKVTYVPIDYGTLVKRVVGRQVPGISIFAGVPNVAVPDFFASGFMKTQVDHRQLPGPADRRAVARRRWSRPTPPRPPRSTNSSTRSAWSRSTATCRCTGRCSTTRPPAASRVWCSAR